MSAAYGFTSSDNVRDVVPGTLADCLGFYTHSEYQELEFGRWISTSSPLNGIAMMRLDAPTNAAYLYIKRPHLYDAAPTDPIHPGFLCELLYDGEHYAEFVKLVTESKVARDYLDSLISWPGLLDTGLKYARELMRVTLAKNAAINVLRELGL